MDAETWLEEDLPGRQGHLLSFSKLWVRMPVLLVTLSTITATSLICTCVSEHFVGLCDANKVICQDPGGNLAHVWSAVVVSLFRFPLSPWALAHGDFHILGEKANCQATQSPDRNLGGYHRRWE